MIFTEPNEQGGLRFDTAALYQHLLYDQTCFHWATAGLFVWELMSTDLRIYSGLVYLSMGCYTIASTSEEA